MRWLVREQANLADTEIGEDLAAETDLAQNALVRMAKTSTNIAAVGPVDAKLRRVEGLVDAESALGVVQIDHRSAPCGSDGG